MDTEILNAIAAKLPGFECPQHWDDVTVALLVNALYVQHYSVARLIEIDVGGGFEDAIAGDKAIRAHLRRRVQPAIQQLRAAEKVAERVLNPRRAACVVAALNTAENVLLDAVEGEYLHHDARAFPGGLKIDFKHFEPPARAEGRPRGDDYDLTVGVWCVLRAAGWTRARASRLIAQMAYEYDPAKTLEQNIESMDHRAKSLEIRLHDYDARN